MNPPLVHTKYPVTLLGAGKVNSKTVNQALEIAPNLVAADGGAGTAVALGHVPQAVIGDFDSFNHDIIAQIPRDRLHRIKEQESTDFEKCLRNIDAPLILGLGFAGLRLDHELAAYNALLRFPDRRCILIGEVDLCFLLPERIRLTLPVGTRVSLFPMGKCTVDGSGLRWPVKGLEMAPDGQIGTSNEASSRTVVLQTRPRKLLAILPCGHLPAVIAALTGKTGNG